MACATSLVKYLLFLFNFIFVVGGIALMVLGGLTFADFKQYDEFLDNSGVGKYTAPPIAMIAFGAIIFFISFMGCCGAIKENSCMVTSYATIMGILLLLEIGVAIAAHVYKDDFRAALEKGFKEFQNVYGQPTDQGKEATEAWNKMQTNLKCCGVNDPTDWRQSAYGQIPTSCYPEGTSTTYEKGCLALAFDDIGMQYLIILGGVLGATLLAGVVFGCCLGARFRSKSYRNHV